MFRSLRKIDRNYKHHLNYVHRAGIYINRILPHSGALSQGQHQNDKQAIQSSYESRLVGGGERGTSSIRSVSFYLHLHI